MAYNGQVGYHPIFAFWAEEGEMLASHLMAGNRYPPSKVNWFFDQLVMKAAPTGKRLQVRADSAIQTSARYVHATHEGKRRAVEALASYSSRKNCLKIVTNEERRFG